ncbi:hypothetical protein NLG97_g10177 [Lecanicillium saksenae]|uniref:Uncharacterized protein n=1 Tax=Lecanicillium saksenae TaxID=468837 RepID=A0ACC1QFR0_9HYPO|nr:hypothetical protein NLG97_g10177 [Lecanicillium saksenae]
MVLGILVAVAAGIAICHTHHKKQRIDGFKSEYMAQHGRALTKEEWKQLCREHKQAWKAEKHARKAEKHMRRAERRGCWRTSYKALPATAAAPAPAPETKFEGGNVYTTYNTQASEKTIQIPVQGPDEPPAYMPGSMTAPPEKM